MADHELAFIGAGNMAEAIARGVIAAGLIGGGRMIAADPVAARRQVFDGLGAATTADNAAAARSAARLLLAVKPQHMNDVLAELAGAVSPDALVISIAAGVSTAKIEAGLAGQVPERSPAGFPPPDPNQSPPAPMPNAQCPMPAFRVVRVMPNTPMLVGCGMSGLARGRHASDADLDWARRLFEAAGETVVLADEDLINAVTAVSGSGPAYFFYLIEWMVAAGVDEGLHPEDALKLAAQTCAGAAKLLAESGEDPRELRRRVTSPGGTTQAAVDLLDARGVAEAIRDAVRAAAARSRELGK